MLLITNDLDEACLLADRIHVLMPAPGGGHVLSDGIPVELARPRTQSTLNREPAYQSIRREIFAHLASARLRAAS